MNGPRRILVRLPNWLGDALMARPLLHGLRRAQPGAEIRAVGPGQLVGLLEGERTFTVGHAWPGRPPGADGRSGRAARRRLAAALRGWRPDIALVLPFSFSSAWFAWSTGARRRIGYAHEGRSLLLTDRLPRPPRGERHLSREYLALGAVLDVQEVSPPPLVPPPGAREAAAALIARTARGAAPLVVMAPRSAYGPAREWPAARFAALARHLVARGYAVLVCGTAAERETCREVVNAAGPGAHAVAGETDLATLAALTGCAALAVCNDSGLAHLAGAVGTPTVVVYGSTASAWTAPLGRRVKIVQHPPVCSPCFRRTCRIGYVCLGAVQVGEVEQACREVAG